MDKPEEDINHEYINTADPNKNANEGIYTGDKNKEKLEKQTNGQVDEAADSDKQDLKDTPVNPFQELCGSLKLEQDELERLGVRQKQLQEEMRQLKLEIDEQKKSFKLAGIDFVDSDADISLEMLEEPDDDESETEYAKSPGNDKEELEELIAADNDDMAASTKYFSDNDAHTNMTEAEII